MMEKFDFINPYLRWIFNFFSNPLLHITLKLEKFPYLVSTWYTLLYYPFPIWKYQLFCLILPLPAVYDCLPQISRFPGVDPGIFCRGGKLEKIGKNDLRGRRPRQKLMIFPMFLCIFWKKWKTFLKKLEKILKKIVRWGGGHPPVWSQNLGMFGPKI